MSTHHRPGEPMIPGAKPGIIANAEQVDASSYVAHGGWRRVSPLHAAGTYLEVIPNAHVIWTNEESEDADQMAHFARADAAAVMH